MSAVPEGVGGTLVLPASDYARDRTSWLAARRSGLGASETAVVLGLNEYRTPYQVWAEKVRTDDPVDEDPSEAARWGSVLEAPVAREVSRRHHDLGKIAPSPGLFQHPEHTWLLATPDRILVERGRRYSGRALALLECKTVGDWAYRSSWTGDYPPNPYLVQVQQQLLVLDMDVAYLAALIGGQRMPAPWRIDRDERVAQQIVEYTGAWWEQYVVAGRAPALTFADRSILSQVYPGDTDLDALRADDRLVDVYARLLDARRREAEAKDERAALEFEVQTALGDRTALVDDAGAELVTWRPTTSRRLDTTALRKALPDVAAEYTTASTSRRLVVKEVA